MQTSRLVEQFWINSFLENNLENPLIKRNIWNFLVSQSRLQLTQGTGLRWTSKKLERRKLSTIIEVNFEVLEKPNHFGTGDSWVVLVGGPEVSPLPTTNTLRGHIEVPHGRPHNLLTKRFEGLSLISMSFRSF